MSTGGPESLRLSPDLSPIHPLIEPTPRLHSEIVLNGHPLQISALELRYGLELTAHVPDWKVRVGERFCITHTREILSCREGLRGT